MFPTCLVCVCVRARARVCVCAWWLEWGQEHPRGKPDPRPPLLWRFKGPEAVCEWELPALTPEGDSLTICAYDYSDLGNHHKLASFSLGGR